MLYGKEVKKGITNKYVGDMSQIADARESVLTNGKAEGVRVIDVKTGSGLTFTVVPSRGMDIAWAEFCGMPIAHIGKPGLASPAFFEKDGLSFLRNFFVGLLTTCGMTYAGAPCEDNGEPLGLHGRMNNTPAADVSVYKEWEGDEYVIRIRGKVQEGKVFAENLVMTREIVAKMGESKIVIRDRVENCGFEAQPLMMLYHCNFGYPVVSEHSKIVVPQGYTMRARDAAGVESTALQMEEPTHQYAEQCFYYNLPAIKGNQTYAGIFNPKLDLGVYVKMDKSQLKHCVEWKMVGEGDYVVGIEPTTALPEGRVKAREAGDLIMIAPGEVRQFDVEIGVVTDEAAYAKLFD